MTKTFAVIGDPIDHSLSPNIHNSAFKELQIDATYIAYRIPKDELAAGIEALKKIKITGFNVTIPHKIGMMKFLNIIDDDCKLIGATNTVTNDDGNLTGHNTDMDGFLDPIKKRDLSCKGADVLLLGAGGAARAIVAALAKEKANKLVVANRTKENATQLVQFANSLKLDAVNTDFGSAGDTASQFSFIINATSIGLKGEPCPISTQNINKDSVVYDIVYMPMKTQLLTQAKSRGATIIYGYEMLLAQAMRSFEIWFGKKAPFDAMKKTLLGGF